MRTPRTAGATLPLTKLDKVSGGPPRAEQAQGDVREPDALFPRNRCAGTRHQGDENITGRIIDIIAPIGRGQRALIVARPRQQTVMMQQHRPRHHRQPSDVHLMVLLVDERPEEVTEMQRTVKGEVSPPPSTGRHARCTWPRW